MRTHEQIRQDLLANEKKVRRWRTRVKRSMTMLEKAERRTRHLEKLLTQPEKSLTGRQVAEAYDIGPVVPEKKPEPPPSTFNLQAAVEKLITGPSDDDLDVRRQPWAAERRRSPADQAAIDKAKSEKAERSKAKAKGQAETRKAKRSGDTKRMPLTGRDAAKFIASGN